MAREIDDEDDVIPSSEEEASPDEKFEGTLVDIDDDMALEEDPDLSELNAELSAKPGVGENPQRNLEIRRAIEARNEQKQLEADLNYLELDLDDDDY